MTLSLQLLYPFIDQKNKDSWKRRLYLKPGNKSEQTRGLVIGVWLRA